MKLTVIYDNNPLQENLKTDWGFSCLIETDSNKILFDTGGNGKILLENMNKLSIDPKSIDIVFLSHFHHDHTGGLEDFLQINSSVKVFYPQSFPQEITDIITNSGAEPISVSDSIEILPDVYSLGEIQAKIPEQSMVINANEKLIVITGCAHPGILNILQKTKENFPDKSLHIVLGGFHLHRLAEDEIKEIVRTIFIIGAATVAPTHCSGTPARNLFKKYFAASYQELGVGKVIELI